MSSYRRVLSTPGATAFSVVGVVSRLPLAMTGLGIVLMVSERTGRYSEASLISASYVLAFAAFAPVQGRLVDRVGQPPVLWAAGAANAVAMTVTIVAIHDGWQAPWPHVWAVLGGMTTAQTGNLVRTRWTHVLGDRRLLSTAFAWEAALDEVVFIVGPVLVTVLTLHVADYSGLAAATLASTLGAWALAAQRSTAPPVVHRRDIARPPIGRRILVPMMGLSLGLGVLFGSTEVIVVAFCDEKGVTSAAGIVLAVWATGSMVAGLLVGAVLPATDPLRRLRASSLVLALLFVPLPALPNVMLLAIGMFLAGAAIAPTLIEAMRLIEQSVPAGRLTEGLAWTTVGLAVGVAPGAALAGRVVDAHGASAAFLVPIVAGLLAATASWTLPTTTRARPSSPDTAARDVVLGPISD